MYLLYAFLFLIKDIPESMYSSYCTEDVLDSVFVDCRLKAGEYYPDDVETGADYLFADWAYGVSLLNLSQFCIESVLGEGLSDGVLLADCLSLASAVARLQGNLPAAIGYAEECLTMDRQSGDMENISSSLNNIAGLYMTYGEPEVARKYIDEAIEIEKGLDRSAYLAIRYGVASEIYLKLGEVEQALYFADEALCLDSLDNRTAKVAVRRSQKGAVLMEMGRYAEAGKEIESAIPVFREGNSLNSLAIALAQVGEIAIHEGDENRALAALDECLDVCRNTDNIYIESRARKDLWQLLRLDNQERAIVHLERYVELQARLNSDKTAELMQAFNVKYETLKKDQVNELLRTRLLWAGIAILLLIALTVAAAVLVVMKNKAANAMEARNAVLVKAGLEKDRLLAIARSKIPHDVSQEIISVVSGPSDMSEIRLTKRELKIAELCAQGLISKEIAYELNISQRTVETHKNNIFKKLGINNTIELVRYMQDLSRQVDKK